MNLIVPYRNRQDHLAQFIPHYLKLGCNIYVIEQDDTNLFKRGQLINIGYELFKNKFDYFIAHDVDMLAFPSDFNYSTSDVVVQLATKAEQFGWQMPYPQYLGGATLFPNKVFENINGFSNKMCGWGAEDDLIYKKLRDRGHRIDYRESRYYSLPHERDIDHEARMRNVDILMQPIDWNDGLKNLDYDIAMITETDYTHIKVKL